MPILMWLLSNWRLAVGLMIVGASFYEGSHLTAQKYELRIASENSARAAEIAAAMTNNETLKQSLEVTKNDAQKRIDALAPVVRLQRVYLPCTINAASAVVAASGVAATAAGGEPLPATPQTALDDFTAGLESDAHEADTIVNNCRVVMEWAKKSGAACSAQPQKD